MKTIKFCNIYFTVLVLSLSCCLLAGCSSEGGEDPEPIPEFVVLPGDRHNVSKSDEITTVAIDTWKQYTFAVEPQDVENLKVFIGDDYISNLSYAIENGILYVTVADNFEMEAVECCITLANATDPARRTIINITQPRLNMPIEYFSQGNVRGGDPYTFTDPTDVGDYYTWLDAYENFGKGYVINGKEWHLPNIAEWVGIFPEASSNINFTVQSKDCIGIENEIAEMAGYRFEGLSDYRSNTTDRAAYAVRLKGTAMESAFRYQYLENYTQNQRVYYKVVVTARKLQKNSGLTLDDVSSISYWENNNENDVSVTFPAAGYFDGLDFYSTSTTAYYWTSEYNVTPNFPYLFYMSHAFAGKAMQFDNVLSQRSVRLVYAE